MTDGQVVREMDPDEYEGVREEAEDHPGYIVVGGDS